MAVSDPNRRCFRDPIPEIFEAAEYLDAAADAFLRGDMARTAHLIRKADMPEIREWTESLWGKNSPYVHVRKIPNARPYLPKAQRVTTRMPSTKEKKLLLQRDGFHCRFCGAPVIRREVRVFLHKLFPEALPWGSKNIEQHAAFQAMWVQYDHIVPHARGGDNDLNNLVITCAPCNYGRMNYLLEEVGLDDPLKYAPIQDDWDGLERVLGEKGWIFY